MDNGETVGLLTKTRHKPGWVQDKGWGFPPHPCKRKRDLSAISGPSFSTYPCLVFVVLVWIDSKSCIMQSACKVSARQFAFGYLIFNFHNASSFLFCSRMVVVL